MALNYQVPSWLVPPSQDEERRLRLVEDAAKERAGMMLRKQIGLTRMKDEAQQLVAQGNDPVTAQRTALINNAHLLFADNPNAMVNVLNSETAQQTKQQSMAQTLQYHTGLLENAKAKLEETQRNNLALDKLRSDKLVSDQTAAEAKIALKRQEDAAKAAYEKLSIENQSLRTKAAQSNAAVAQKREKRIAMGAAAKDPELMQIETSLKDIRETLAQRTPGTKIRSWPFPEDTSKVLQQKAANLERQRKQRLAELGINDAEETAPDVADSAPESGTSPAAATKRLRWTPDGLVPAH